METAKTIHELDHETVMLMLRSYGKRIGLLAKRGEPLSATVQTLYQYMVEHPRDERGIRGFRSALHDWMRQHLETTSRLYLAQTYGYLVEGEDPNGAPRIVTVQ